MLPNLLNAFSYFLFPKRCIHCKLLLAIDNKAYFCDCCSELLTPLTEKNRCHYCFQEEGLIGKNICYRCCTKKEMLCKKAAVFEYLGPASSLLKSFKYGEEPYLAKGIGGFMAAQLLQLGWKIPDIIIPIPTSFSHKLSRGFDHTFLIAKTMGKILSCPVKNAMWRDSLDYSQAGLSRSQRKLLKKECFQLKKKQDLTDKHLLLIDDVTTSGTTLNHCCSILQEECPSSLQALTFCIA